MRFLLLVIGLTVLLFADEPIRLPDHFIAQFTQMITNPEKKVITYQGSVKFSNLKHLKWVYETPTSKEVCSNGVQLVVVDHDLEQISYFVMDQGFDLAKILSVAKPYEKKHNVFLARYNEQTYGIAVDEKRRVRRIMYQDSLENKVEIVFDDIKYGEGNLPYKDMLCEEPEMYDRIED